MILRCPQCQKHYRVKTSSKMRRCLFCGNVLKIGKRIATRRVGNRFSVWDAALGKAIIESTFRDAADDVRKTAEIEYGITYIRCAAAIGA